MIRGKLSQYFVGVAIKRLSTVETDPKRSNQHEFNGVSQLRSLLGALRIQNQPAQFVWLGAQGDSFFENSTVTWYDAREDHPTRTEYRLYFKNNSVMNQAKEGDLMIVGKRPSGDLVIMIVEQGSSLDKQILWLFGLSQAGRRLQYKNIQGKADIDLDFSARAVLEQVGIDVPDPAADSLHDYVERFEGEFPSTAVFSATARESLPDADPRAEPDLTLLAWIDREKTLFQLLENQILAERLKRGFLSRGKADVEAFLKFSLTVQNRRKSRAGHALENHLDYIFNVHGLRFERQAITEGKIKPDFLFPGQNEYHNQSFPDNKLSMLGAKSTCKERWRQVLAEAERITHKHLLTLEEGISEPQTDEMQASNLQLVLPKDLHHTYLPSQQEWLWTLQDFIDHVTEQQA